MKAAALRGALSDRARNGRVHVVAGVVEGDNPSTKAAAAHLATVVSGKHLLVVVERHDEVTRRSLRNIESVHLLVPGQLNTYDVLVSDDVVFTEGALAEFLAGPPKGKGASAVAREEELEQLADAVTTLAKAPQGGRSTTTSTTSGNDAGGPVSETQGNTSAAGDNVSDEEMAAEVEGQTSSDLQAEDSFEAEAGGASSDTEAAKDPGGVGE
jgi:hypothetical protein